VASLVPMAPMTPGHVTPGERPTPLLLKLSRMVVGTTLVVVGMAGLVLPILPGWLLIIAGLALLARDFFWARRLLDSVKRRWAAARRVSSGRPDDDSGESDSRAA
jgi:hypothetical protein